MPQNEAAVASEIGLALESAGNSAQSFWDKYLGTHALSKIIAAAILLVVCVVFIKILMRLTSRVLERSRLEKSAHGFIRTMVRLVLVFIAIMLIAGTLGVDTSSLLAIFSIAGLAISLSVQNALSNTISAVMLLTSKPYKVGDYIAVSGMEGTVREIGILYTRLVTLDGRDIRIPNSQVLAGSITNYSSEENRRVVLTISAGYDADIETVKAALRRAAQDDRVLPDEPVFARVSKYADSCIEYTLRFLVRSADYWPVYFDVLENVKRVFDEAGIQMTYPHINVHMDR